MHYHPHPVVCITSNTVKSMRQGKKNEALPAENQSNILCQVFCPKNLNGMGCVLMMTEVV